MLRRFDRFFLVLEGARQLTGVVLLQPIVHQRVIDAGLGGEPFQAAFARKVRLYDPELELGTEPSVRLAAHKSSEGLRRRSNPDLPSVQPAGVTPLLIEIAHAPADRCAGACRVGTSVSCVRAYR